jgi:hypothetical protein
MKKFFLSALIVLICVFSLSAITAPTAQAACSGRFLTFKAWYDGLDCNGKEVVIGEEDGDTKDGLRKFIWTIVLNVIDDIFQLIGYVSVGFLIYGGYSWIFSQGNPDMVTKGRKTITNAIVGLIISLFAVLIVNLVLGVFS